MLVLLDTQILSYAYKGQAVDISAAKISSVTAHEFLEIYDSQSLKRFRYYIKYLRGHHSAGLRPSPAEEKTAYLERLHLDFGSDHPKIIEFHSHATAAIINDRNILAFAGITSTLSRRRQRKLRSQFAFLCNQKITCVPLQAATAELGAQLLWRFSQSNNIKTGGEGKFRNSINDMMILATAITARERLVTDDKLLRRFAATLPHTQLKELGDDMVEISFREDNVADAFHAQESKGYINRGWRIATDLRRTPII